MRRIVSIALLALAAVLVVRSRPGGTRAVSGLGRALRKLRSGDARSAANDPLLRDLPHFTLASPAFADGAPMGPPYVDAGAVQPPLTHEKP